MDSIESNTIPTQSPLSNTISSTISFYLIPLDIIYIIICNLDLPGKKQFIRCCWLFSVFRYVINEFDKTFTKYYQSHDFGFTDALSTYTFEMVYHNYTHLIPTSLLRTKKNKLVHKSKKFYYYLGINNCIDAVQIIAKYNSCYKYLREVINGASIGKHQLLIDNVQQISHTQKYKYHICRQIGQIENQIERQITKQANIGMSTSNSILHLQRCRY